MDIIIIISFATSRKKKKTNWKCLNISMTIVWSYSKVDVGILKIN